ncbi:MAG: Gfo/Idh/MocA family oxidoreductase [Pseudomonadota bacterium]
MTHTPTRYGIIGSGMMGQEHIKNIALLSGARVGAVYEPNAEMAALTRTLTDAPVVDSLDALLNVPGLDALVIASPNHCHVDQMEAVAARRPLPLLVEKPLFTDPTDTARIEAFGARYPAPVWVAMEYRYMPPVAALIEAADDVTGGITMLTIREHRFPFLNKVGHWNRFNRYTGGTLVEKCCHFFDLMRLILRAEPVRVMASGSQAANHLSERYDGEAPDILDNAYVIVDFDNGARAMLELCMFAEGSRYQEELTAVGPSGKIEALVPGPSRFWPADLGAPPTAQLIVSPRAPKGPRVQPVPVDPALLDAGDHNGSTFYQHQSFLALLRGEASAPAVSLHDGMMAVRMGHAAQESIATGRTVTLPANAPDPRLQAVAG